MSKLENVEVKKVDSQGRVILPSDWRAENLGGSENEVYVIKRKDYIKIVPKRGADLTKFFDQVDLDVDAIGEWGKFERRRAERMRR